MQDKQIKIILSKLQLHKRKAKTEKISIIAGKANYYKSGIFRNISHKPNITLISISYHSNLL